MADICQMQWSKAATVVEANKLTNIYIHKYMQHYVMLCHTMLRKVGKYWYELVQIPVLSGIQSHPEQYMKILLQIVWICM